MEAIHPEERSAQATSYDEHRDVYLMPREQAPIVSQHTLDGLLPSPDPDREVDDWGRSSRVTSLLDKVAGLYYRYWFRVEVEGVEHVPASGGALLVSNHAGAVPPDALMIGQAIRNEHPAPRPLYYLVPYSFRGIPLLGMLGSKIGIIQSHPANAQRLLRDEGKLALVFPERHRGMNKLYWQRYRLRRFGRGNFVATALKAKVPIVPVAVVGAEEAMPAFAHIPLPVKVAGVRTLPVNHALPHMGLPGAAMFLPAKIKIRFLEPMSLSQYGPESAADVAQVQYIAEEVRSRIQSTLEEMLADRRSVWFG